MLGGGYDGGVTWRGSTVCLGRLWWMSWRQGNGRGFQPRSVRVRGVSIGEEYMVNANRVVIVTGAAGGMGAASVSQLSARGVNVLCVDRDAVALDRALAGIHSSVADVFPVVADVSLERDVAGYVSAAVARWDRLDGIFNIAAINGAPGLFADTSLETYEEVMRINVTSVWLAMRFAIPELIRSGGGVIVNVGSVAAVRAAPMLAAYTASKHAVAGLTKTVAVEYARQKVRANLLCPGSMDTPMVREMLLLRGKGDRAEGERLTTASIPDGRLARPEELASTGVWLLLDAPEHLSGQLLMVDGGRSAT